MFDILIKKFEQYPKSYRPSINLHDFSSQIHKRSQDSKYWSLFYKETRGLCGYAMCNIVDDTVNLSVVSVNPQFENKRANAVLGYHICKEYINERNFKYICNGERNISHETNYTEYLIKYFGVRKAYCTLNIVYRPFVYLIVTALYPFRVKIESKEELVR